MYICCYKVYSILQCDLRLINYTMFSSLQKMSIDHILLFDTVQNTIVGTIIIV